MIELSDLADIISGGFERWEDRRPFQCQRVCRVLVGILAIWLFMAVQVLAFVDIIHDDLRGVGYRGRRKP